LSATDVVAGLKAEPIVLVLGRPSGSNAQATTVAMASQRVTRNSLALETRCPLPAGTVIRTIIGTYLTCPIAFGKIRAAFPPVVSGVNAFLQRRGSIH